MITAKKEKIETTYFKLKSGLSWQTKSIENSSIIYKFFKDTPTPVSISKDINVFRGKIDNFIECDAMGKKVIQKPISDFNGSKNLAERVHNKTVVKAVEEFKDESKPYKNTIVVTDIQNAEVEEIVARTSDSNPSVTEKESTLEVSTSETEELEEIKSEVKSKRGRKARK